MTIKRKGAASTPKKKPREENGTIRQHAFAWIKLPESVRIADSREKQFYNIEKCGLSQEVGKESD